ncbi:MAG: T9SS type A sorting domain-containing protein, partial [Bacteroidetes bacterium]|nr:T9SS type A sorting domain-containing protein [Bacteroidota bacterium]
IKCADLFGDDQKEIVVSTDSPFNIENSTGVIHYLSIDNVPNKVSVFYNHSFEDSLYSQELIIEEFPTYFTTLGINDADLDGRPDVFYLDRSEMKIKWLKNESDGIFGSSEYVSAEDSLVEDFQFHELDGDSIPDLIFLQKLTLNNNYRKIGYRPSSSSPADTEYVLIRDSLSYYGFSQFGFVDVEQDEDIDIIYYEGSYNNLIYYENSGNGEFSISEQTATGWLFSFSAFPIKGDLNNNIDLLWPDYQGHLLIYNDVFTEENEFYFIEPTTFPSIRYAIPYDLNQDGLNDLLCYSSTINSLIWFENLDNANFSEFKIFKRGTGYTVYENTIDIDNDGKNELILLQNSTFPNENLSVYNLENTNTDSALVVNSYFYFLSYTPIVFSDLNNDSLPEIAFFTNYNGTPHLATRKNLGDGMFDTVSVIQEGYGNVWNMIALDWDEDGLNDLIFQQYDSLMWLRNMGDFQFDTAYSMNVHEVYALYNEVRDWNNDGKPDLFISLKEGPAGAPHEYKLYCMQNGNGTSKYLEELTEIMQETFREIKFAEFNQNGPPEVIGRSYSANSGYTGSIKYSEMSGDFYLDFISLPFSEPAADFEVADMNGDGKDDVFTHNSSYLKIYFNVFNSNITSTDEGQMKECEIYPNPSGGRIHFTKQCEGNSAMHISIRGIDGRLIYEENTKNDFVDLPEATQRGLYFLIVKTEAETYNFRLILK